MNDCLKLTNHVRNMYQFGLNSFLGLILTNEYLFGIEMR